MTRYTPNEIRFELHKIIDAWAEPLPATIDGAPVNELTTAIGNYLCLVADVNAAVTKIQSSLQGFHQRKFDESVKAAKS